MKIIHCADVHADSKMDTHFKEKAAERRKEVCDNFAEMARFAKENLVRTVIIAGDLFDTKNSEQKTIKKRIAHIISQNPEIDFLYLRGNHDEDVAFAEDEAPANLKRFSKDEWKKYSYENVDVYGREFSNNVGTLAGEMPLLDSERVNIVVLHGQVASYKAKEGAPVISLPRLENRNIDYAALGHIHEFKMQRLDARGVWCYSGCLEGRGFDECGKKGFVLLDIQGNSVKAEFVPSSLREIHDVDVDVSDAAGYSEIMNAIEKEIASIPEKDIVQVNLRGEVDENSEIECAAYESALASSFYFFRANDFTKTKIEYEKYENDVSLKGEFIRLVNADKELPAEEKTKIIMAGIKALSGRLEA